ncbi:MAG TPA: LpqB family beta-propeller domain-containing protein, partial [Micromonosporaceae bacterium]
DGAVVVNLSSQAAEDSDQARQNLLYQLRWSLRAYATRSVELQIEGQSKGTDNTANYLAANVAADPTRSPELFAVARGKVTVQTPPTLTVPVLNAKANAFVRYAAVSTDHNLAAFVQDRGGSRTLTVVAVKADGSLAERLIKGRLEGKEIGRPVWIPRSGGRLLVPASGRLYLVNASGAAPIDISPRNIGSVTSVSVAPDGRRVALVADGRAYVAALPITGGSIDVADQLREVLPNQLTAAAVAWTSEVKILVAGRLSEGNAALFRVSVDGAIASNDSPSGQPPLTDVVAYADSPVKSGSEGDIVIETETNVLKLYRTIEVQEGVVSMFYANG